MEDMVLERISDDELLRRLGELVTRSRRVEADLVWHIGEVDERKLFAREAFPSMFAYCTGALHLSEAEAYLRITVARAARRHAVLLEMLRDGRLHLRGIAMMAPLLTDKNRDSLLRRVTHRSKREIEEVVAELSPRPDVPTGVRKLPEIPATIDPPDVGRGSPIELCPDRVGTNERQAASGGPSSAADVRPAVVPPSLSPEALTRLEARPRPASPGGHLARSTLSSTEALSPGRYKVQFTASAELKDKIDRLTALMRSEIPDGDLARVIERAVSEKLERLEARRFAKTGSPRKTLGETDTTPTSRSMPAAVRRAVHERDGGRCTFIDAKGRRCDERTRLEFHHRHPYGMGGDHSAENISLLCHAHNTYLAELDYGRTAIAAHRTAARLPDRLRNASRRGGSVHGT